MPRGRLDEAATPKGVDAERAALRRLVATTAAVALATLAAAAIASFSASREAGQSFLWLFGYHELRGGALLLLGCLVALWSRGHARACALAIALARRPVVVAAAAAALLGLAAVALYEAAPFTADEHMHVFQAEIFAAGELTGHWPPELLRWLLPPAIASTFYLVGPAGQVASAYWPGFALLLAPWVAVGAGWMLNPLLAGLAVAILMSLARRLYPAAPAAPGWVALFTVASPAFVANAISFYPMNAYLCLHLLFTWLLADRGRLRAAAAGVVGSLALVLHNPVPHALFALPWMSWLLARRERRSDLLPLFAGYLPLGGLAGLGWLFLRLRLAGGPFPVRTLERHFALPDAALLWVRCLEYLRVFAWAVPALPLLAGWGVWLLRRHGDARARELAGLLAASVLTVLGGYFFLRVDQGYGWGFRHLHYAWGALPLLAVAPLVWPPGDGRRLTGAVAALTLLSLVAGNAIRLWEIRRLLVAEREVLAPLPPTQPAVCFVTRRYNLDRIRNDPFLRDPVLMLVSQPGRDERLLRERFPGARPLAMPPGIACWSHPRTDPARTRW